MLTFLYIRGEPGVGKITIGRMLAKQLYWPLFWIHDLDKLWEITGGHTPRLLDEISIPIINHLLEKRQNIIYVRPSREQRTINTILGTVAKSIEYRTIVVNLVADYHTLCRRVESRPRLASRVASKAELDCYLAARPKETVHGEHIIDTAMLTPAQVVDYIKNLL